MGEEIRSVETCLKEEESQALVDIWKYVLGFTEMAVVKCAVELGIADVLENNGGCPMTLSELSSALGSSPSPLYRIMRFLIHRKIFKEVSSGQGSLGYVQTPLSRLLVRQGEQSMAAFVLLESSHLMLAPWHGLAAGVLGSGGPAFKRAHGDDLWRFMEGNPAHSKLVDDSMASVARVTVSAVTNGCPEVFKGLCSLVDVGGGNGTSIGMVVKACPWIHGINLDLPHVVAVAPQFDGVEHIGGNFLSSIPKADAAHIMNVLHNWDDDDCIQILKNCKEAIPHDKGKVIIVEIVMERKEEDKFKNLGLVMDMVMMAHTNNGKERTLDEWAYVLREAGFTRHTVKHIEAFRSVIEAYP